MARKIFKYNLPMLKHFTLDLPANGEIIHVETQKDISQMWVLFEDTDATSKRAFSIYGTGDEISNDCIHRGTFVKCGGVYVWHLFETII